MTAEAERRQFHAWLNEREMPFNFITPRSRNSWSYDVYIPVRGITKSVDCYQQVIVELKSLRGSKTQKEWQRIYEKSGTPYKAVKDYTEARKFIEKVMEVIEG